MIRPLAAALLLPLLFASAWAGPETGKKDSSLNEMIVGLVYPPTDAEAVDYLGGRGTPREPTRHDRKAFQYVRQTLQKEVGEIRLVKSLDEAREAGADVAVFVEIESKVPYTIFGKATYNLYVALVTFSGRAVTFNVQGQQRGRPFLLPGGIRRKALRKACRSLETALGNSRQVEEVSKGLLEERKGRAGPSERVIAGPDPG